MSKQFPPVNKFNPCEACGDTSGKCRTVLDNPDLIMCMTFAGVGATVEGWRYQKDSNNSSWAVFGRDNKQVWTAEQAAIRDAENAERKRQRELERQNHIKGLSDDITRDGEYQRDIKRYGICDLHRQEMDRRGMTPDQYEGWAYSVGSALHLPIFSPEMLMVGHQVKTFSSGAKYVWGRAGQHQRRSTGEQPMTHLGNRKNPREIHFVESTGFKPKIFSDRHPDVYAVGASGNQFVTSKAELTELLNRYPNAKLIYHPDGGACKNTTVESNTIKLYEFCKQHDGREMEYDWYGQYEKSDGDIDEIPASTKIKRISHKQFIQESVDRRQFLKLGGLSVPRTTINEQWVPDIDMLNPGSVLLLSSNVGTGKTTWMKKFIAKFDALPDRGRLVNLGARNVLLNQQNASWGIESYRVGHGQDDAMLNHAPKVSVCFDSIMRLDPASIPPHSMISIDEIEQFLTHSIEGNTTGQETAKCQDRLGMIIERTLCLGGYLVACEDDITDLTWNFLNKYLKGRYPIEVIENTYQRFDYQVNIGRGTQSEQVACALARLQAGQNIIIVSTGQSQVEIFDRYLLANMPEISPFVMRVDGKMTGNLPDDLMRDPGKYCVDNKIRVLMLTTTAESGFSINDESGWFDRVMAWFPTLDIRTHYQMLNRLRSNAVRDIAIPERTIEGSAASSTNPATITKYHLETAKRASLQAGLSWKQPTEVEIVLNDTYADLTARKALSSRHAKNYLKTHLQSRGHCCVDMEMGELYADICKEFGIEPIDLKDLKESIEDIKSKIENEAVDAIHDAVVPKSMNREIAVMIQKSSLTTPEQKIVAKKCLLQLDLPGADLQNKDFLLESIVKNRGKYRNQCQVTYLIDKLDLCNLIDNKKTEHQLQQPHRLFRQASKYKQVAEVFEPVIEYLLELGKGELEYVELDSDVIRVNKYLIAKWETIKRLTGMMMLPQSSGNKQSSPIANINKMLKFMGFKPESQGQRTEGKRRIYRYRVVNGDCVHRQTIYDALERRYREEFTEVHKDSNTVSLLLESLCIEDISAISNDSSDSLDSPVDELRYIIKYPEYYETIRSGISHSDLLKASKLLSESELNTLRSIENNRNNRAA